jgi:hypothetical protein
MMVAESNRETTQVVVSMSLGYLFMYLPLLVAVSCVIGASRHEKTGLIIDQIVRTAVWVTSFMLGIYAVLQIVSWMV